MPFVWAFYAIGATLCFFLAYILYGHTAKTRYLCDTACPPPPHDLFDASQIMLGLGFIMVIFTVVQLIYNLRKDKTEEKKEA